MFWIVQIFVECFGLVRALSFCCWTTCCLWLAFTSTSPREPGDTLGPQPEFTTLRPGQHRRSVSILETDHYKPSWGQLQNLNLSFSASCQQQCLDAQRTCDNFMHNSNLSMLNIWIAILSPFPTIPSKDGLCTSMYPRRCLHILNKTVLTTSKQKPILCSFTFLMVLIARGFEWNSAWCCLWNIYSIALMLPRSLQSLSVWHSLTSIAHLQRSFSDPSLPLGCDCGNSQRSGSDTIAHISNVVGDLEAVGVGTLHQG